MLEVPLYGDRRQVENVWAQRRVVLCDFSNNRRPALQSINSTSRGSPIRATEHRPNATNFVASNTLGQLFVKIDGANSDAALTCSTNTSRAMQASGLRNNGDKWPTVQTTRRGKYELAG